jgi:hypothetical protein
MTTYLEDALARIVDMEKVCLTTDVAAGIGVNAVPRWFFTMETFPYWTNVISQGTVQMDSEDYQLRIHTFIMRLVIGHVTSGYVGESEDKLAVYIPEVLAYFGARPTLKSPNYATDLTCLWMNPQTGEIGARITGISGLQVGENSGVGAQQVSCDFTLQAAFNATVRT